jgi:hypothetical protein
MENQVFLPLNNLSFWRADFLKKNLRKINAATSAGLHWVGIHSGVFMNALWKKIFMRMQLFIRVIFYHCRNPFQDIGETDTC